VLFCGETVDRDRTDVLGTVVDGQQPRTRQDHILLKSVIKRMGWICEGQ
jgi:hypothetical protein